MIPLPFFYYYIVIVSVLVALVLMAVIKKSPQEEQIEINVKLSQFLVNKETEWVKALTNIREQTLSRYKTGERIPDTYELYRIAVALGVSIDWLLGINSPTDSSTSPLAPTAREAKLTEKLAIATAGLEAILAQLKKQ